MSEAAAPLRWSSQLTLVPAPRALAGDKIILPPKALEDLLAIAPQSPIKSTRLNHTDRLNPSDPYSVAAHRHAQSQFQSREHSLPQPLTFRLVNPQNDRIVYAGVAEFSAEDGCASLSPLILQSLGVEEAELAEIQSDPDKIEKDGVKGSRVGKTVTVHLEELPKGTFVRLRPLEAGYDPEDWKALLEKHMRSGFTTLTRGEVLTVRPNATETFQFLVDEFKPEANGICVVDTDLEVDIEALNEDQARETMKRYAEKHNLAPGSEGGSSRGGEIKFLKTEIGQVLPGEYVDYELQSWPRAEGIQINLDAPDDDYHGQLDLLISPFSAYQRAKPREDEHVFADFEDRPSKRIKLTSSNAELEDADSLYVAVRATPAPSDGMRAPAPRQFTLRASVLQEEDDADVSMTGVAEEVPGPDEVICMNCKHAVPKQSLVLHENFCRRNNIRCPHSKACPKVFQRNSPALKEHWHCEREGCNSSGSSSQTQQHHMRVAHTSLRCPSCSYPDGFPSLPTLAHHRVTTCPGKEILCRFCHLAVPQEGTGDDPFASPNPEVVLSGMTAHEVADGARTTECHLCKRIVRLRDMDTHMKNHDYDRKTRPTPRICRNVLCGRTLDGANVSGDTRSASQAGQGPGNDIGLCSLCFQPLYSHDYDPESKALKRRVERRYLTQLSKGCGNGFCRNPYCKSGKANLAKDGEKGLVEPFKALTINEAIPIAKPFVDGLLDGGEGRTPLHLCTNETNQRRRGLATMLEAQVQATPGSKQYSWPWCVAALEAHGGNPDKAQEWLNNFAPTTSEEPSKSARK